VLQAPLCNGLFSLLGVATVAWFFTADTLPLSFFDGCFAIVVIAARADALPPMSLQAPSHADFAVCDAPLLADALSLMSLQAPSHAHSAERVIAPFWRMLCCHSARGSCSGGYFAVVFLAWADALSPLSRIISVDALPPRLHLLHWQHCVDVFYLQVQSARFVVGCLSLPPFFLFRYYFGS
jgi:hypothetical protein